jgi:sugar phosphate isomerase/epimerase
MNISVSSLGFCGHPIYSMGKLPPEMGIEIFYEWGGETYWELALTEIMRERTGKFSIHAPYQGSITEMSLTPHEDALFEYLKQPFRLYHKFGADGYVVHMNAPYPDAPSPEEKAERLKRVEDRLARLNESCDREGVAMLVENLAYGHGMKTLCDQEDFLRVFKNNPALNCIVDTGHAALGSIDINEVQMALGSRLKAYHLHDNDGHEDLHQRVGTGVNDWKHFGEGARLYTPNAHFIMEYNVNAVSELNDYAQDADRIRAMLK